MPDDSSSHQPSAQALGMRIRELREARGLSQRQLAERLHLSKSIVAKYEAGVHWPSVLALVRLAEWLGVSLDELVRSRKGSDDRLQRCLRAIEAMDPASQLSVVDVMEGIVNAYRKLFVDGQGPGAAP